MVVDGCFKNEQLFREAAVVNLLRCHLKQKFCSTSAYGQFFMALWVTEHPSPRRGGTSVTKSKGKNLYLTSNF